MTCQFRCQCGRIAGEIVDPRDSWHLLCYCRDCRAYAHALEKGAEVLDEFGGTHVIGVRPRQLRLLRGTEVLRCLSLTPRGLLRWYAGWCGSPISIPRAIRACPTWGSCTPASPRRPSRSSGCSGRCVTRRTRAARYARCRGHRSTTTVATRRKVAERPPFDE